MFIIVLTERSDLHLMSKTRMCTCFNSSWLVTCQIAPPGARRPSTNDVDITPMYFLHKTSDRLPRKPLHILRTVMRVGTLQVTWTRSAPLKNAHLWSVTEGCNVHKKKCSSGHQKGKSRRSSGLLFSLQYILTLRILNN